MSNATFKHQPLNDPARSIRLVRIRAQQTAPFLGLGLSTHSVADDIQYFAVSYTWGDGGFTEDIILNGHLMKITKNCRYALEQINRQYPADECSQEPPYLWIDSICINQEDNDEKGYQVAMMGDIYAKATKVLACIGPAADDSSMLRTLLDDIKTKSPQLYADKEKLRCGYWYYEVGSWGIEKSSLQSYFKDSVVSQDELAIQLRKACFAFAERRYWSRLWIIQEFTAPDRSGNDLEVLCGYDSCSKAEINLCFYLASYLYKPCHRDDVDDGGFFANRFPIIRRHSFETLMEFDSSAPIPFGVILFTIKDIFHCTKPEDRIYGLLPLAEWPDGMPPIRPVYNPTSALDLAELLLSSGDEESLFCWTVLEALEIYHDYEPLRTLVEARIRIQDAHGTSSGGKYPLRASRQSKASVLPLHKNDTGHLSASIYCFNSGPDLPVDPIAEEAAILYAHGGIGKPQVLMAGSSIAGLLCSEARGGDLIMHYGMMGSILVLRPSDRDGLYSLVGQGLLSYGFTFPQGLPSSKGVLERKLEKVEEGENSGKKRETLNAEIGKACQPGQADLACVVELRAEPIEWLILEGQDFSKDRRPDKDSRLKRLSTKLFIEATIQ
ncbi:uncharacterized protein FIESC28_10791 [Fusarium coffeatum]|uniref:Heterokaryon incompatibility domain-containing protein n=1 Tax=Fusarium coffeatum TaxID=231269 RepID=A0A366QRD4_9HYPO|nr:uncharacterized protein FIESC28_10791 [Fusarium coffeatum]RBR07292.1 hypothetical protein FIESC28_10791 [Fusarium coffeatum]